MLFKNGTTNFHDSWHQGFYFDPKVTYGIYQKDGGPCGILAAVNAFYLKHQLYIAQTSLQTAITNDRRDNYLAAALAEILINASDE